MKSCSNCIHNSTSKFGSGVSYCEIIKCAKPVVFDSLSCEHHQSGKKRFWIWKYESEKEWKQTLNYIDEDGVGTDGYQAMLRGWWLERTKFKKEDDFVEV